MSLDLTGTTDLPSGKGILIGQKLTATVNGVPNGPNDPPASYAWTLSGGLPFTE